VWTVTVSKQAAKVIEQKSQSLIDAGDRPTLRYQMADDLWVELDGNQFKQVVRGVIGYGKFQQTMSVTNASVPATSGATIWDEEDM
jgi:hypothetical protein